MRRWRASALFLALCAVASWAAPADWKAEPIGACGAAGVSGAMMESLQTQGVRVSGGAGTLCELWLRKLIPSDAHGSGADYGALTPGAFAGVLSFASMGGDYRGNGIPPGVYTMRYARLPADGNHMGVSPTLDYFMLSPAGVDLDPNAVLEYQPLVDQSRKASGRSHPSILYLVEPSSAAKPSMNALEGGHWSVEVTTKAGRAGGPEVDLRLAIVLIGKGES